MNADELSRALLGKGLLSIRAEPGREALARFQARFEIERPLGRGGFAEVFIARDKSLGRLVAVKRMSVAGARENVAERFRRELETLVELRHEGIPAVLDAVLDGPELSIAMELIEGRSLADVLDGPPGPAHERVRLVEEAARIVHFAHEHGVIHRDLKPANIMVGADGKPRVIDFGIAKVLGAEPELTASATVLGTLGYAPPEQMRGESRHVDARADVFSLGAILYHATTGEEPFPSRSALADVRPDPPRTHDPRIPPALEAAILRAIANEPEDRFASARELADAIHPYAAAEGWSPRSRRGRLGFVLVLLLVLALVAALVASRRPESPPPPTAPSPSDPALGWSGERLPSGLRRGAASPVLLWNHAGLELELVHVPPGDFLMGAGDADLVFAEEAERPRHRHPMPKGYWIGRTDVTWRQYLAFCAATGTPAPERPAWAKDDHPVVNVTWDEARTFCFWAGLALPTEAEWDKAARGDDGRVYPWGNTWDASRANHGVDPDGGPDATDGFLYTSPVAAFPAGASPCGALDMAGNVWQWCEDGFDEHAYERYEKGDLSPAHDTTRRVLRGGCYKNPSRDCRSSYRAYNNPSKRLDLLGFRVVLRP